MWDKALVLSSKYKDKINAKNKALNYSYSTSLRLIIIIALLMLRTALIALDTIIILVITPKILT